jgi:hypothetical protein
MRLHEIYASVNRLMPLHELSIVELEKLSAQRFVEEFPQMDDLRRRVTEIGEIVLENQPSLREDEIERSDLVCRLLFYRLMIFAVSRLAFNGYSLQAATLASSSFESSFMITYVGANNEKAERWFSNPSPFNASISVKNCIEEVFRCNGLIEPTLSSEVSRFYEIYQMLCSVKHFNRSIQTIFQHRFIDEEIRLESGPDAEPRSIWLSSWTLCQFFTFFLIAARTLASCHVSQPSQSDLLNRIAELMKEVNSLVAGVNAYQEKFLNEGITSLQK